MYSQVVSLAPDSFTGYYNLGGVRILQGKYEEAIPLLQRSLEIRKTADATSNLGTAYFQLHRYADSAAAFEQATQLDPTNYVFWGNLGDAYYWAPGRRAEAAAAYGKGIALGEEQLRVMRRLHRQLRGGPQRRQGDLAARRSIQPEQRQPRMRVMQVGGDEGAVDQYHVLLSQ